MNNSSCRSMMIGVIWILLVAGCWLSAWTRPGVATRWHQEATPTESISLLRLGVNGEILAQAPGGNLYEIAVGSGLPWQKVREPAENPEYHVICDIRDDLSYFVVPPPGKVISRLSQDCHSIDVGHHVEVVLLENGEVWAWRHVSDAIAGFYVVLALLIAAFLGTPLLLFGLNRAIKGRIEIERATQK